MKKIAPYLVGGLLAAAVFLFAGFHAYAHEHSRPDLNAWFSGLKNAQGGSCCIDVFKEALPIDDPDFKGPMADGSYEVKVGNEWIVVDAGHVVPPPNKFGRALLWAQPGNPKNVYCFLPGAGA